MKLKNRKTGEIVETDFELSVSLPNDEKLYGNDTYTQIKGYSSIKDLLEEWEDYKEEPKEHWYISADGAVRVNPEQHFCDPVHMQIVGNDFETEEEAEKAVEKLKAWKRLKDKGFRFINFECKKICKYYPDTGVGELEYQVPYYTGMDDDMNLLFGGEE